VTHDLAVTRVLDAPVEEAWRAWTEPERVRRWWGPTGFTSPSADMDVRVGGTSLVCMRAPAEYGGQDRRCVLRHGRGAARVAAGLAQCPDETAARYRRS